MEDATLEKLVHLQQSIKYDLMLFQSIYIYRMSDAPSLMSDALSLMSDAPSLMFEIDFGYIHVHDKTIPELNDDISGLI